MSADGDKGQGGDGIEPYPRTPQQKAARDALLGLADTVDNTKEIMKTNMDLVHERGQKLKDLEHTTEAILGGAKQFAHDAAKFAEESSEK